MRGLRRAWTLVREAGEDWLTAARADLAPAPTLPLHTFHTEDDICRFTVTTDRVLGPAGRSQASLMLNRRPHFSSAVFSGTIDYVDPNPDSRGGFAAIRTLPGERVRDLSSFEAFEMRIKTDGRPYVFNVKGSDSAPEFLWQMMIVTRPHVWCTVAIPFRELLLTRRGRIDIDQQPLDPEFVHGVGLLLADGRNGPFKFEIQHISAIRDFVPEAYASEMRQRAVEAASGGGRHIGGGRVENPPPTSPSVPRPAAAVDHSHEVRRGAASADVTASGGGAATSMGKRLQDMTPAELVEHYRREREAAKLRT